jgi:recombination DNA repair RAD52 pathway protein
MWSMMTYQLVTVTLKFIYWYYSIGFGSIENGQLKTNLYISGKKKENFLINVAIFKFIIVTL